MKNNEIKLVGENLYLRTPTIEDKDIIWNFRQEFFDYNSYSAGDSGLKLKDSFEEWFTKVDNGSRLEALPEGRVLCTQFLTFRKSDNKLVGMINVRHTLNDYLEKFGGHIGDCIRPTERQKGYATEQKRICLDFCKTLGLNKVLVTAKSENEFSIRSITKCGGILENQLFDEENNQLYNRYWINL